MKEHTLLVILARIIRGRKRTTSKVKGKELYRSRAMVKRGRDACTQADFCITASDIPMKRKENIQYIFEQ